MAHPLVESIKQAGVVGAGGAGFPAHVKLDAKVDTYIANAAECEPLLCKDQEVMKHHAERVVHGLRLGMEATGATRGVIAIKAKYKEAIAALEPFVGAGIELYLYDNFYPAGDEFVMVYDVTGRLIPPAGLPLQVGCVVNNVETLMNVSRAVDGQPVTHSALTVAGAVQEPVSAVVPIGVSAGEVLELAGGATVPDPVLIDGGAMMGPAFTDLGRPVTKTSAGYIVLPSDHKLAFRKLQPEDAQVRIARSACDQCMQCTELCPRYLLGYAIEPHKVMRSVGFAGEPEERWARLGLLCCECSLCSLYSCPEDLPPREMCVRSKKLFRERGLSPEPLAGLGRAHPMREHRRVPIPRLTFRLGLSDWDVHAPLTAKVLAPATVEIALRQHIGAPAEPVVRPGDGVRAGQLIAAIPEGKLGANIHASIDGRVLSIDDASIKLASSSAAR